MPRLSVLTVSLYLSFLKDLVLKHRNRYHGTAGIGEKRDIIKEIVSAIPNEGRFLKRDGDQWVVLSKEQAFVKTAQALRYQVRMERNMEASSPVQSMGCHPHNRTTHHVPEPIVTPQLLGVGDPPNVRAQKTLELYSQWMVRANQVFWEQVAGPEARALFPDDMLATVPISSKYETSFPSRSRDD
jgi:hypothetical protein